jgi:hypothetical protein
MQMLKVEVQKDEVTSSMHKSSQTGVEPSCVPIVSVLLHTAFPLYVLTGPCYPHVNQTLKG